MPDPFDWLAAGPREGWDGINRQPLTEDEKARAQEGELLEFEEARLFHDVLMVGRGPELLDLLHNQLLETPTTIVTGQIGFAQLGMQITPEQWLWIRAGQNSVFHHFQAMIEKARRGPPKIEPGNGASGNGQGTG